MESLPLAERWITSRCHSLVNSVTAQLNDNDFGPAGQSIYAFLWDEYADWYIEISKKRIGSDDAATQAQARRTLVYVLDSCLRLLHPFMPFITEELWQRLPHDGPSLMVASWPQRDDALLPTDEGAVRDFESLQALVRSVRNARSEYRVEPGKLIAATVVAPEGVARVLQPEAEAIASLARIAPALLEWASPADAQPEVGVVRLVVDEAVEAYLPLSELVDAEKERARLGKQQAKLESAIEKLNSRIRAPGFADKAPAQVLEKTQRELQDNREQLEGVLAALSQLPKE